MIEKKSIHTFFIKYLNDILNILNHIVVYVKIIKETIKNQYNKNQPLLL